jgi:putative ABC transport system ATP-binding protein
MEVARHARRIVRFKDGRLRKDKRNAPIDARESLRALGAPAAREAAA